MNTLEMAARGYIAACEGRHPDPDTALSRLVEEASKMSHSTDTEQLDTGGLKGVLLEILGCNADGELGVLCDGDDSDPEQCPQCPIPVQSERLAYALDKARKLVS